MPFLLPDSSEAASPELARLYGTDLEILARASGETGVIAGCAVSASATPGASVVVASGRIAIGGKPASVAGGTTPALTADAASPRWYLVEVGLTGNLISTAGTAAASPIKPSPSSSLVVTLASVFVPANDTAIASNQIIDERVEISSEQWQVSEFAPDGTANNVLVPCIAETIPRMVANAAVGPGNNTNNLRLMAIWLRVGQVVTNINMCANSTTSSGLTASWTVIAEANAPASAATTFNVLKTTTNNATQWTAHTVRTWALSGGAWTVPKTGLYYVGFGQVNTTTAPTLVGGTAIPQGIAGTNLHPRICGISATGATTTPPAVSSTLLNMSNAGVAPMYCWLT